MMRISKKILLIEDQPATIGLTEMRLQRAGHKTLTVTSICAAGTALQAEKFDILIVDIRIPRNDGEDELLEGGNEVMSDLRNGKYGEVNRTTPFIVLTAQKASVNLDHLRLLGGCLGVEKKLTQYQTLALVDEAV